MLQQYLSCGKTIETTNGRYMIVESNDYIEENYSLIDLDCGYIIDTAHNINDFRGRIGEIITFKN